MSLLNSSNPFVGLRPFESDESLLFFGRQEQTLELLQRLHLHHFVAVVGSSGSGKSSLIRAGLIPSLKAGYLVDDRDKWMITIMKPGQSPLYNLSDAILNQLKPETDASSVTWLLKKIKEEGSDAVLEVIENVWKEKNTNFFLLVDQFEELFRFSMEQKEVAKRDEAIDFVNIILELSRQTDVPLYVVITMRSDFIGDCAQFNGLPEAMNQSQYLVPRLNRVQLKTAIEGPVKLYGGHINATLISKLLNDLGTVKDELPLLQHALMRVWDHEVNVDKSGELDIKDYESIGGIEKALSNHADEALRGMSNAELSLTKKIFQALTAIDENGRKIRRPAHLKELQQITGAGKEQLLFIINRFIQDKRSFLIINKTSEQDDAVIDISHESLIRQWNTLSDWVDEEAQAAKNYFRLVESAQLYHDKKKDLLRGSELQVAIQWCKQFKPVPDWAQRYGAGFEESIQYLKDSEKDLKDEEKRKKIQKRKQLSLVFGLIALVIIALISYGYERALKATSSAKLASSNAELAKRFEEQAHVSDSLKIEAELQKDTANYNSFKALEEKKKADISAAEAKKAQHDAEVQRGIANTYASNARKALQDLDVQSKKIKQLYESYKLNALSQDMESKDPTIALRLEEAAIKINPDSIILSSANRIYEKNAFYKTVFKDSFTTYNFSPDKTKVLGWTKREYIVRGNRLIARGRNNNGSSDYSIRASLFDIKGKKLNVFNRKGIYESVDFTPDLTKVLIASGDSIVLWNIDGTRLMKFTDSLIVNSHSFFLDDKKIIIHTQNDIVKLVNIDGGKSRVFRLSPSIYPNAFSSDGSKILAIKSDSTIVLKDTDNDSARIFKNPTQINKIAFSPDEKKVLASLSDNSARLWNTRDSTFTEFRGHTGKISSLAFSPGGTKILTGSDDGTARLWDTSGRLMAVFKGHTTGVSAVAFSADGTKIFTGSLDSTIRVWDIPVIEFSGHTNQINLVAYSPDKTKILTGSADSTARLWDLGGNPLYVLPHSNQVSSVDFSRDGKRFLTAADDTAMLWDIEGGFIKKYVGHTGAIQSVAFSPDNTKILTGSDDSTAILWELNNPDTRQIVSRHSGGILSVAFSRDGSRILTGSRDSTARLSNLNNIKSPVVFKHSDIVNIVTFSRDDTKILTASADSTAILWNPNGVPLLKFKHNGAVESAAFSPDDTKILTGSRDNTAKLWSIDGTLLHAFKMPDGVIVRSVAFSPDGLRIFIGAGDNVGRLYDVRSFHEFLKSDEIDKLTKEQEEEFNIK